MLEKMMNAEERILSMPDVKNNTNIITLHDKIEVDKNTFFIYDYCNNGSL